MSGKGPGCLAYVGLGGNLGATERRFADACRCLDGLEHSRLVVVSSLYRSPPLRAAGVPPGQPDYVNAVACLETRLGPEALLEGLQAIEARHGRRREGPRWGARTLDLDLLLYGDRRIRTPRLTVPHPGLPMRDFVLYPLHEIGPEIVIPGQGPIGDCLERCPVRGLRRIARPPWGRLEAIDLGST